MCQVRVKVLIEQKETRLVLISGKTSSQTLGLIPGPKTEQIKQLATTGLAPTTEVGCHTGQDVMKNSSLKSSWSPQELCEEVWGTHQEFKSWRCSSQKGFFCLQPAD